MRRRALHGEAHAIPGADTIELPAGSTCGWWTFRPGAAGTWTALFAPCVMAGNMCCPKKQHALRRLPRLCGPAAISSVQHRLTRSVPAATPCVRRNLMLPLLAPSAAERTRHCAAERRCATAAGQTVPFRRCASRTSIPLAADQRRCRWRPPRRRHFSCCRRPLPIAPTLCSECRSACATAAEETVPFPLIACRALEDRLVADQRRRRWRHLCAATSAAAAAHSDHT